MIATWLDQPEDHDYPAAESYLSLLLPPAGVARIVKALRAAEVEQFAAKDLLRAARLAPLDEKDPHVAHDIAKVKDKKALSPVLLVRGVIGRDMPLTIADGYHRICAVWHLEPNTVVPAKIIDLAG